VIDCLIGLHFNFTAFLLLFESQFTKSFTAEKKESHNHNHNSCFIGCWFGEICYLLLSLLFTGIIGLYTYAERLAVLNLETLELRRLRFDLIFYYKAFNHLTPFDPDLVFTIYSSPNCLRSNKPFILKPITVPNKVLSTTFYIAADAWNYLPIGLRLSTSLPAFKSGFKGVDFSKFLKDSVNLNCLNVLPFFD
jgi:hypothetical protein